MVNTYYHAWLNVTQQVIQWNCPQEVKSCWLVRTGFCVLFRIRNQLERFPGCIKLHGKIWSESPIWCPRVNVRTTVLTPWTTLSVFYWLEGCIMMIVIVIICFIFNVQCLYFLKYHQLIFNCSALLKSISDQKVSHF